MLVILLVLFLRRFEDEDERRTRTTLQLQAAKQFFEGQLNANVKFAEVGVGRAHFIEAHLIDDRFDLENIVAKALRPIRRRRDPLSR